MRHLRSILYALVLAPAVWTLAAVGFTQDLTGRARSEGTVEMLTGLSLLLLAGAAYAILLLPRLSPAGPVLAGLIFLVAAVWVLIDPASFDGLWPAGVRKEGFDLTLPGDGLAALLAVPLLCTALITRRWRQHDRPAARSIRAASGKPVSGPHAGFDAIGLGAGDATQPLAVGRTEEATQVISTFRPTGARTPASHDSGAATRNGAGAGTGVAEPVAAARATDVTEPARATVDNRADSQLRTGASAEDADAPQRRSEPTPKADTTGSTTDAAVTGTSALGTTEKTPHAAVGTEKPEAAETLGSGAGAPEGEPTQHVTDSTRPAAVATAPDADVTGEQPTSRADDADSAATAPAVEDTDPGERTVEQPTTAAPAAADRATADRAADPDGHTVLLDVEPGDDRTQVIPVGLGRLGGGGDDERTQVIGVGGIELEGKTEVISAYGPDAVTHALDGHGPATRTQATGGSGSDARGEVPAQAGAGERTTGTVTPPAENTQVLGIPVAATTGERTTVRRTPANRPTGDGPARDHDRTVDLAVPDDRPTVDIAARDDRPTAAIPARRTPDDDEPTTVLATASSRRDDEPTTDLGAGKGEDRESTRPMTVGGLERPADEVAADTARRTGQTTQRRPAAVPAQPSRARTSGGVADDGEPTRQL